MSSQAVVLENTIEKGTARWLDDTVTRVQITRIPSHASRSRFPPPLHSPISLFSPILPPPREGARFSVAGRRSQRGIRGRERNPAEGRKRRSGDNGGKNGERERFIYESCGERDAAREWKRITWKVFLRVTLLLLANDNLGPRDLLRTSGDSYRGEGDKG